MDWVQKFKEEEGKRLIYLAIAFVVGVLMFFAGRMVEQAELSGSGLTLVIACGTIAINRARGTTNGQTPQTGGVK